jgi:hypothetical protein
MIKSFNDRRLKRLYERGDRSRVAPDMADKIENILGVLDRAGCVEAMSLPGFRLHRLRGGCCRVLERDRPRQLARDLPVRGRQRL